MEIENCNLTRTLVLLKLILQHGANINVHTTQDGRTPLNMAVIEGI